MKEAALHTRILLCGDGGDEVLKRSSSATLLWRMRPGEWTAGIARSLAVYRQRPDSGIRSAFRRCRRRSAAWIPYPVWLNPAFERRLDLRARWQQLGGPSPSDSHPLRWEAYNMLAMAFWPSYFEFWDPGVTRVPVEGRYPFLDVRMVEYLLAIPPVPWCVNKQILREAMRDKLPDVIRRRGKAPLGGDPLRAHLERTRDSLDDLAGAAEVGTYVDRTAMPRLSSASRGADPWLDVRPLCLSHWLKRCVA
jgi:asparagine synthase (glutamine-hydrolysing)